MNNHILLYYITTCRFLSISPQLLIIRKISGENNYGAHWKRTKRQMVPLTQPLQSLFWPLKYKHTVFQTRSNRRMPQELHKEKNVFQRAWHLGAVNQTFPTAAITIGSSANHSRGIGTIRRWKGGWSSCMKDTRLMGLDSHYHQAKPKFHYSRKQVHRHTRLAGIYSAQKRVYKKRPTLNITTPLFPIFYKEISFLKKLIKLGLKI